MSILPTLRAARPGDWSFLDHLQRRHHDAIGFLSRTALEQAIDRGRVLLALENDQPAGYLYGKAPYQRQPHVGIIFQAAIDYDARRRLLGTALVEAFASSLPDHVTQLCLWCASDLDANLFWSAVGFAPVATRAGARSTKRTHLFWCRSRRPLGQSDSNAPPLWVPETTRAGVMRETRRVTLIPARA